jgi:hypothetical protein
VYLRFAWRWNHGFLRQTLSHLLRQWIQSAEMHRSCSVHAVTPPQVSTVATRATTVGVQSIRQSCEPEGLLAPPCFRPNPACESVDIETNSMLCEWSTCRDSRAHAIHPPCPSHPIACPIAFTGISAVDGTCVWSCGVVDGKEALPHASFANLCTDTLFG